MLVETFLTHYTKFLTKKYLTFEKYLHSSPPEPQKNKNYFLYIHIPFCQELCPYCSFVSTKIDTSIAIEYFKALKKEIEIYKNLGYCFNLVYIGGGTPTIMPQELSELILFIKNSWNIKQISVETSPNHLTPDILEMLKKVGVNRLSVGVQSFDDNILKSVERLEKYGDGKTIKQKLKSVVGLFDTLNIDMIFNFPNQTEQIMENDIKCLNEINADQITCYPLMISDSQKNEIKKRCGNINPRMEKILYKKISAGLSDTYNQGSIWCFNRKKGLIDEYILDHDEYVATGPGSWGYIDGTMYSNTFSIPHYIDLLQKNIHPIIAVRKYSTTEQMRYDFLIKLLEGSLNLSDMERKYGRDFRLNLSKELDFLKIFRAATFQDDLLKLTPKGRYYWIILMRIFFSIVGDYRKTRDLLDNDFYQKNIIPEKFHPRKLILVK